MLSETVKEELNILVALLDPGHPVFGKDFRSNVRFITSAAAQLEKQGIPEAEIVKFIKDAVKVHIMAYNLL